MGGLGWTPVNGAAALYRRRPVVIASAPGVITTTVRFPDQTVQHVNTQELEPAPETLDSEYVSRDTLSTTDELWTEAQRRLEIIRPLLNPPPGGLTRKQVLERAQVSLRWPKGKETPKGRKTPKEKETLSPATLYRWIDRYERTGEVLSLVRQERSDKGGRHLPEAVVQAVATSLRPYLDQKHAPGSRKGRRKALRLLFQTLMTDIKIICRKEQLNTPSESTVRNMLRALSPQEHALATGSRRTVARHRSLPGTYQDADHPYDCVQIDHTPINVMVVDADGLPVGRPFLTLAIDVRTRMVIGMYLSFAAPSAYSVLRCLAQAMLPKVGYLKSLGLDHDWPCYGKITFVHSDNGPDFISKELKRALIQRDIGHQFREQISPHWGGHIESLMDTTSDELQPLPGYTGRNIEERKDLDLDPDGTACMSLKALQTWLLNWICNTYNRRKHSALGDSPYNVFLKLQNQGSGTLDLITGARADKLNIDFLPTFTAAVTPKGVVHDYVFFYEGFLEPLVGVKEHPQSNRSVKHRFHYDWHDMSAIYLYSDQLGAYQKIRYANLKREPISYWEHKQATKRLRDECGEIDEEAIFQSILEGRRIVTEAKENTRKVRQQAAKLLESAERRGTKVVQEGTVARSANDGQRKKTKKPAQPVVHDDLPDFPVTVRVRA